MVTRPYDNKEYITWIRLNELLNDTVLENGVGPARVTPPTKMCIRDMAILIGGALDDAIVTVQFSPDDMETREAELNPDTMEWFDRDDGTFTKGGTLPANPANIWENIDAAEGWFRIKIENINAGTNPHIRTRPRTEHVQRG